MPIHGYPGNVITANPTAPTSSVASGVWTTEQQLIATAAGNWPFTIPTQQISRSLRFNSADSAYLNRTPASASNRKTWTWSGWVKRSTLGTVQGIFDAYVGTTDFATAFFNTDNTIYFYTCTSGPFIDYDFITTAVFRDVGAWYHIVLVLNTASATQADRFIVYINGVRQTGTNPSGAFDLNVETYINSTVSHRLGSRTDGSYYSNGYMTEINFINGQALTPSSFGRTNTATGVWEPLAYTGTYGTNGFYLNFSDNSGTTSTTLGKDYSGNGNNWTPNNFSVTAGVGNDSLVDSPTSYGTDTGVGGTVRGNYCTMNPLTVPTLPTLANGNLDVSVSATGVKIAQGTFQFPSSGKWYYECTFNNASSGVNGMFIGITSPTRSPNAARSTAGAYFFYASSSALLNSNGTDIVTGLSTISANEVFKVAVDVDNSKVWIGRGSIWYNSSGGTTGDPAAGTNPTFSISAIGLTPMSGFDASSVSLSMNFGQRAFAYTAPSGFKALCTQNLPTPTIGATSTTQAGKYFNPVIYTGTGSTRDVTGVGFSPDLVWVKRRSATENNLLANTISGGGKSLYSNLTLAEQTNEAGGYISAFVSDGFTVTAGSVSSSAVNASGSTYVSWNWNAGGSTVTNTSGTISAQVRANTTSGFSIVTYTGNGTNGATIGHGLGVTPQMFITKNRNGYNSSNGFSDWSVYHVNSPVYTGGAAIDGTARQALWLHLTAAASNGVGGFPKGPTSTVFTPNQTAYDNVSGQTYVAYCFAPVAGYSAFGSYTGNGSADGPFVFTNFRPRFVMIKCSSAGSTDWEIHDTARDASNVSVSRLYPNLSVAEDVVNGNIDITSSGFKIRNTDSRYNTNAGTYIYAAFAESPFKYSLAR